MDIVDHFLKTLGVREKTGKDKFEDKIREMEGKRSMALLLYDREMDKENPDFSKADAFDEEARIWEAKIWEEKKKSKYFDPITEHKKILIDIRKMEAKKAEIKFLLEREREKFDPDLLIVDIYETNVESWESDIARAREKLEELKSHDVQ